MCGEIDTSDRARHGKYFTSAFACVCTVCPRLSSTQRSFKSSAIQYINFKSWYTPLKQICIAWGRDPAALLHLTIPTAQSEPTTSLCYDTEVETSGPRMPAQTLAFLSTY